MSNSDFSRVLVRDERLDCHPSIPFAVYKSGQNVTVAKFQAISANAASHTYNIQVPSETTIIDRRVMWSTRVTFTVNITVPSRATLTQIDANRYNAPRPVLYEGENFAFSPWPLHTLCSTQQITINNNTVSINMNDVIPAIAKMGIDRELQQYNGCSLTETDFFFDQGAARIFNATPTSGVENMNQDRCYKPRSTVTGITLANPTWNAVAITTAPAGGTIFSYGATTAAAGANGPGAPGALAGVWGCQISVTFIEPLICAPWIYHNPYYNGQGFYGIQNLNMVFNIIGGQNSGFFRALFTPAERNAVGGFGVVAVRVDDFQNSEMIFNFLSPKPSDMLTARNVVPYWEMPRFTVASAGPGPATINTATTAPFGIREPGTRSLNSQTLQLNQIPDKLIIFVRRAKALQTAMDTNYSLGITNISINFNNQSGILASATQDQLWRFSVESGSIQTYEEFRGVGNVAIAPITTSTANNQPLLGSYLMLEMGRHIQITEDYYASGSLGNFNLQFTVQVENYSDVDLTGNNAVELVLITLNSGLFVSEKGQSAVYTGVLTKDDVLSASASEAVNERALSRMIGGNWLQKVVSVGKKVVPVADAAAKAFLPEDSKVRKGIEGVSGIAKAFQGEGRAGSRVRGAGKGSAKFSLDDRLV